MCGLYSFRRSPEETRSLFKYLEEPDFSPRAYVTPASPIAIVRLERGERHFALVRWGLVPAWVKEIEPGRPLINARAETVLAKPSFRNAMRRRRCLIPADGFYEWQGDVPGRKQPFFIHRPGHGLFAFAGLWEHWQGADGSELESAVLITTEPNAMMAKIHNRMPVIIMPEDFGRWLDAEGIDARTASALLHAPPEDYFVAEPTVIARQSRKNPPPPAAPPPDQMKLL
jgi:putative SOS response-associated peptidase YedK